MIHRKKRRLSPLQKLKKRAPKIPEITCPLIDGVLGRIEEHVKNSQPINHRDWAYITRRMEKIRSSNEMLRDASQYWYDATKDLIQ